MQFSVPINNQRNVFCFLKNLYKADLNFMKGVAWDSVGAAQHEYVKKAGELISDVSKTVCTVNHYTTTNNSW